MAGKGGGAWKVAYADFVTAMMAFFMVMWLVGQDEQKKQAVSEYFRDPWATSRFSPNRSRDPSKTKPKAGLTNPDKKFLGSDPVNVPHDDPESPEKKTPRLVTIREPQRTATGTIVSFLTGSSNLTEESKKSLDRILPDLVGLPQKIEIRGHSLKRAGNDNLDEDIWHICYKRSLLVMNYLAEHGIPKERMRISIAGPYEPLTLSVGEKDDKVNARVEVFLLSETVNQMQGNSEDRGKYLITTELIKSQAKQQAAAQAKEEKKETKSSGHAKKESGGHGKKASGGH
jgi:chemotaxis protein MotB